MPLTLAPVSIPAVAVPNLSPVALVPVVVNTPVIAYQTLPERAWLVSQGNSYGCVLPAGIQTAAATVVEPTQTVNLSITNGEQSGGKTYIIERVFGWINVTPVAAASQLALFGQIVPALPVFALTADDATVIRWNLTGNNKATGRSKVSLGKGTPTTPAAISLTWMTLGSSASSAAAGVGAAVDATCFGRYLLPPGAGFCLTALTGTQTGAVGAFVGLEWHEVQLPLN